MTKKILCLATAILMFIGLFFAGCKPKQITNVVENYDIVEIFLEKGEKTDVDFDEQFKDSGLSIKRVIAASADKSVFTVKKNKITATGTGRARLDVEIVSARAGGSLHHYVTSAMVYVIDQSSMTEIKTAQDLDNIRLNMSGTYILKSDIDLSGYNWNPIGWDDPFCGTFANRDGFKIKNLTVSGDREVGGLFGYTSYAYIDGLILENVDIDVLNYDVKGKYVASHAGGISAFPFRGVIRNCTVSGSVKGQDDAGGIAGHHDRGNIIGCTFNGYVKADMTLEMIESMLFARDLIYAGGIAGRAYMARISDCSVKATVQTIGDAGGILGGIFQNSHETYIINCSVKGTIDSPSIAGGICGRFSDRGSLVEEHIKNCSFSGELLNAIRKGEIVGSALSG